MAIVEHFSHGTIRRLVVAFATLFNGYQVKKPDDTLVDVPIKWSSKQKWYTQLKENAEKNELTAITLPRMGFIISGLSYDPIRKKSSINKISVRDDDDPDVLHTTYEPVPYNLDMELYIATRTVDEGLQLLEQIVPFFTPSFNITINEIDVLNIKRDIPVKLNSVNPDLKTEGDFDGDDIKLWDMSFTLEMNLYKNISSTGLIKTVVIDTKPSLDKDALTLVSRYEAKVDPNTAYIDDEYEILESIGYVQSDVPKVP